MGAAASARKGDLRVTAGTAGIRKRSALRRESDTARGVCETCVHSPILGACDCLLIQMVRTSSEPSNEGLFRDTKSVVDDVSYHRDNVNFFRRIAAVHFSGNAGF